MSGDGSFGESASWADADADEDAEGCRLSASMPSDESGVELTRLSSGVRLEAERKTASADLRSFLLDAASAFALAADGVEAGKVR